LSEEFLFLVQHWDRAPAHPCARSPVPGDRAGGGRLHRSMPGAYSAFSYLERCSGCQASCRVIYTFTASLVITQKKKSGLKPYGDKSISDTLSTSCTLLRCAWGDENTATMR